MPNYDYTFKILMLGDASVGKTSLTKRYVTGVFNQAEKLTIGVDFLVKTETFSGKRIKLQIWDIGGEERFRFLLPTYVLGANAAFLLFDVTRKATLESLPEWISIVKKRAGDIPIMLVGSKLDLARAHRQIPREHGIQIAEKNDLASFVEISSKENTNVDKAFDVLVELTIEKMEK